MEGGGPCAQPVRTMVPRGIPADAGGERGGLEGLGGPAGSDWPRAELPSFGYPPGSRSSCALLSLAWLWDTSPTDVETIPSTSCCCSNCTVWRWSSSLPEQCEQSQSDVGAFPVVWTRVQTELSLDEGEAGLSGTFLHTPIAQAADLFSSPHAAHLLGLWPGEHKPL